MQTYKGCETSIITHFLESRLTDGGEVVSLTQKHFLIKILLELSEPLGHSACGSSGSGKMKTFNDLIGNRTSDLPVCRIVPKPTTLLRASPN
jgi:hypothetical protein